MTRRVNISPVRRYQAAELLSWSRSIQKHRMTFAEWQYTNQPKGDK